MDAKEFLSQAYKLDRQAMLIVEKAEKLRASLYGYQDATEAVAKVNAYEQQANAVIDELVDKRIEIENAIKTVPDETQREVLERRYLLFQRWDGRFDEYSGEYTQGIAEAMGYSRRQILRIHGTALQKIKIPE